MLTKDHMDKIFHEACAFWENLDCTPHELAEKCHDDLQKFILAAEEDIR